MMVSKNKSIGIWGFGIVGKAAARYFLEHGYKIGIMDKRIPTADENHYLKINNIQWYNEIEQEPFFYSHDHIIPSPGINIGQLRYATHRDKWIHELDFFYHAFHKPIIAITGSVGKTSTTYLLGQIYKELGIPVVVGGNIGTATFDLIDQQNNVDSAILEVSSFQLNYCKAFAPTLAMWTNFHPNHLDHHATEQEYFLAKQNILTHQKTNQYSLVPLALRHTLLPIHEHQRSYFTVTSPDNNELETLTNKEQLYYIQNDMIMRYKNNMHVPLLSLTPELYNLSFIENILILTAACDILGLPVITLQSIATKTVLPAHRMEKIGSLDSIDFYNDSKATTTASTLAAVAQLSNYPLHLFLGGLSKGVDREPFIAQLKNRVKYMYCFGKEAEILHAMCAAYNIPSASFTTLDEAVDRCIKNVNPHDCVLLSPAGSSYDLYENYEQRGNHFKELITKHIKTFASFDKLRTNGEK